MPRWTKTWQERFAECVHPSIEVPGCLDWAGRRLPNGYGMFFRDGEKRYAHRIAFELRHGAIPQGKMICHHCDRPCCVNPDHLFLGDAKANARDMVNKGRYRPSGLRGQTHPMAKIDESTVAAIRTSTEPNSVLAAQLGLSASHVGEIRLGRRWRHVTVPIPNFGAVPPSPRVKLTWAKVREIRAKYTGVRGQQTALAREYGVNSSVVCEIVNGNIWIE